MNIFFKSLFAVTFLLALNNSLFSMKKEVPNHYTAKRLGFSRRVIKNVPVENKKWDFWNIEIVKYEKPSIAFFGSPWFKKTYTMEESAHREYKTLRHSKILSENPYELCLKTKVLLGTLMLAPVVGLGYYFNWFQKK